MLGDGAVEAHALGEDTAEVPELTLARVHIVLLGSSTSEIAETRALTTPATLADRVGELVGMLLHEGRTGLITGLGVGAARAGGSGTHGIDPSSRWCK